MGWDFEMKANYTSLKYNLPWKKQFPLSLRLRTRKIELRKKSNNLPDSFLYVWSSLGPVPWLGVRPLILVQLNSSLTDSVQTQLLSKVQFKPSTAETKINTQGLFQNEILNGPAITTAIMVLFHPFQFIDYNDYLMKNWFINLFNCDDGGNIDKKFYLWRWQSWDLK